MLNNGVSVFYKNLTRKLMMRIVFIGASSFGLRCLKEIISIPKCKVTGIVTNPETFSISYRPEGVKNVLHIDFKPLAQEMGIPIHVMENKMSNPALIEQIESWKPDFILVVGWYHMVPKNIRNIAPTAGLHASLLPDYSGGAPLVWAIINGEKKTGISLFIMDDGVDSGDIIGQVAERIFRSDTIATLYCRIEEKGIWLLKKYLPKIAKGSAAYTLQNENKRRVVPQRSPEDGLIDWNLSAKRIYDFVRAQTKPYPGAFTLIKGKKVSIWKVNPILDLYKQLKPGYFTLKGSKLIVGCNDGAVSIENFEDMIAVNGKVLMETYLKGVVCFGEVSD
jgi:methionyl-tRNA formyltransferase